MTADIQRLLTVWILVLATAGSEASTILPHSTARPSIDIPAVTPGGAKRSITLDDMVSLRELHEPRQSPDGRWVAFLVKEAFRSCNCYRTALYAVATKGGGAPRKLVEEDYLADVQWSPDGRFITYLSSKGGSVQLWRQNAATRRASRMLTHTANRDRSTEHVAFQPGYAPASGVLDYRWSPDGTSIAYTVESPSDPAATAQAAKEGFRYDDTKMGTSDLMVGDWTAAGRSKQLWIRDLRTRRERLVWATPSGWYTTFTALSWSPDGRKLAFFYSTASVDGADYVGVLDVPTSRPPHIERTSGILYSSGGVAWAPDRSAISYLARPQNAGAANLEVLTTDDYSIQRRSDPLYPGFSPWLAWDTARDRKLVLSAGTREHRQQAGIYALSHDDTGLQRISPETEDLDDCDRVVNGTFACVEQAPSMAPRVALVSAADGTTRSLTSVNPEMASVELGSVRELHWKNSYGEETNGFLVLPTQVARGTRLPLVVIGYGSDGEFITTAAAPLTTYPAQAFARDGIAALVFNYPRFDDWQGPSFVKGSRAFGYGPLDSIRTIIEQLDAEGLIDPHRVGMMGHSLSGFWVQLAITHTDLFKVVEMHNGGTLSEPGTYWDNGNKQFREMQEHIMGGPPYGETLQNYLDYSTTLTANRIHVPVLMEYDAIEAYIAMQYYEALQHYGVPVDFFVYPNDSHVTEQPEHRYRSMQRNLDWFEFWLLGKENPTPSSGEQYDRWRRFRSTLDRMAASGRPPT
jgi:dipeptidyl aminopeptidase/acylaminoacyl peptidase